MASKNPAADQTNREYEKFEPSMEWAREAKFDTLIVHLPGFRKEQLKVQVTSSNKLRISGERPLGNNNKWSCFRKEFPIPLNYDSNEITAKFEGGNLFIKHPKAKALTEPAKLENAYSQAQKTSIENQGSRKANNGEAKAAFNEAKTAASQKSDVLAGEGKSTSGASKTIDQKDKKIDNDVASAETGKEAAGSSNSNYQRDEKFRTEDLKQALGGLVMDVKQRRKYMNLTVAVLVALVACIYAKNAIWYIGKSKI